MISDPFKGFGSNLTREEKERLASLDLEDMRVTVRDMARVTRDNEWMPQILKVAVLTKGLDELIADKALPVVLAVAIEMIAASEMSL